MAGQNMAATEYVFEESVAVSGKAMIKTEGEGRINREQIEFWVC